MAYAANVAGGGDAVAARAAGVWAGIGGAHVDAVTVLKPPKRKSAVYLLRDATGRDVVAKRASAVTLRTERDIYSLLNALPVASITMLGFAEETAVDDEAWLFTAYAGGAPFSPHDDAHRSAVADWMAAVHTAAAQHANAVSLPDRGIGHYRDVLCRAESTMRGARANPALTASDLRTLDRILRWCDMADRAWALLDGVTSVLPRTLVHGGFGAKNVRVAGDGQRRLWPLAFDWEAGGWGTPAADLAAADPDAYHAGLRAAWPGVSRAAVGRLASVGRLFAALSAIPGEERSLHNRWSQRVMAKMRVYEVRLARAITELGMG
ncbi:MAG TPA: hypothetical protein VNM91_10505 [Dehalococcoidia bacterium]|nr:hypothetical protein [Dehalococcoidia bacterium]